MADHSRERDSGTDEETAGASDTDSDATDADTSGGDFTATARPTAEGAEPAAADATGSEDGRLAQLAARWRPTGLFWRFVVGVSALSVAALLVLAVIATAKAVFDDDYDDGWFAYSTPAGPDGVDFVGEVYHNGAVGAVYGYGNGAGTFRPGDRRKKDLGDRRWGQCWQGHRDGESRRCQNPGPSLRSEPGRVGPKLDTWGGSGDYRGGSWSFDGSGLFGHRGPAPDLHGFDFGSSASPFRFFDESDGPLGFRGGERGPFGFLDDGATPFGAPLSELPGPLGLIPGFGEEELSGLRASCEQLEAELDALDRDAESDGLPQIGIREFLLLVICPAGDAQPSLFGGDDQATADPDGDGSVGPGGDGGGQ